MESPEQVQTVWFIMETEAQIHSPRCMVASRQAEESLAGQTWRQVVQYPKVEVLAQDIPGRGRNQV